MNKDAMKKRMMKSKPMRSCRKCGTTFQQELVRKECPFCGASSNRMEENKGKNITTALIMKRVKTDALYRLERGMK